MNDTTRPPTAASLADLQVRELELSRGGPSFRARPDQVLVKVGDR